MSMNINYLKNPNGALLAVHGGLDLSGAVLALALTRKFHGARTSRLCAPRLSAFRAAPGWRSVRE